MALFGPSAGGRREPRSAVEFRAGKMTLTDRIVTADKRKGLVYLKLDESQLLHFCWKDRTSGRVEDDFIIFPGDAEFSRVAQCTTGRVVLLKFKNSSRKFFYWMQEPKEDRDEEICKKVNDLILNPRDSAASLEGDLGGLQGLMGLDSRSLQGMLGNMDRQQLMELLSQGGGAFGLPQGSSPSSSSSTRPATTSGGGGWSQSRPDSSTSTTVQSQSGGGNQGASASTSSSTTTRTPASRRSAGQRDPAPQQPSQQRIQLSDLRSILSSITPSQGVGAQASSGGVGSGRVEGEGGEGAAGGKVDLADAITPNALRLLVHDPLSEAQLQAHLPETPEDAATVLTSPQFRQALGVMGAALNSGQLGPLMSQFGLGQTTVQAAATGNTIVFAEAIQNELHVSKEGDTPTSQQPANEEGSPQDDTLQSSGDKQDNMDTD